MTGPEPAQLVLLRHGQSTFNARHRFTGAADPPLTKLGIQEARTAAAVLTARGFSPDCCFVSALSRARRTADEVLATIDVRGATVTVDPRLNERHYGAMEGLTWPAAARRFGPLRVFRVQRGYSRPPGVAGEGSMDVLARVSPFWVDEVMPRISSGQRVLVVAHGNLLRVSLAHLLELSKWRLSLLTVPRAQPQFLVRRGGHWKQQR